MGLSRFDWETHQKFMIEKEITSFANGGPHKAARPKKHIRYRRITKVKGLSKLPFTEFSSHHRATPFQFSPQYKILTK